MTLEISSRPTVVVAPVPAGEAEVAAPTESDKAAVGVSDSHDAGSPDGPTESPIGTRRTGV